ncbi:2,4'-dihydroxyacetophenone dioxygenase family protein [Mangrovivirga sp. M17]|uniref:2,4'-dihydroxyacetophenone dioxygenase family protein n=1 Tax=Mangrovivirga halotolerans TaxID=2993936 RepID=A0ABT3RW98_9BACT|nr:2,4'-dihydroxyacetophenone dioxygenase family protein [Mangrovivirga halotolerans]MCX2745435.1 2,4'-dihydroxyacetophenone dioxygenase family protein [Mangrovivirga halotolerans]
MDRRKFIVGTAALALISRFSTAADQKLYDDFLANPHSNHHYEKGDKLKALAHATHIGENDLPFIEVGPGMKLKLLMVDLANGLWVTRILFEPGAEVNKHYHTGPVLAFTVSGEWYYKEYPKDRNKRGSFLYEPAHSLHTLTVPVTNKEVTEVCFSVVGSNLNVDENDEVESVTDANSVLEAYKQLCGEQKISSDKLLIHGV